jgi:hypothetical protein
MSTDPSTLAVDLGTANTVSVLRRGDGDARPVLSDGSPLLPSAVYADPDGSLVVGRDAVASARLDPARFEPHPARRIDDDTVELGDRRVEVADLLGAVLRRVAEEARTDGTAPTALSLTCPAGWGATRRLALTTAASRASLPEPTLIEQPMAAASYYAKVLGHDVPVGSSVVIYDLGAGTFDASVVTATAKGFVVVAVDGRETGGLHLDDVIIEYIGGLHRDAHPDAWARLTSPSTVEDRRELRLFRDDVRTARERLSRHGTADLVVPILGVDVRLTREELERLAEPMVSQTIKVTQGVMRWAKVDDATLAGVFLVGGGTRMPLVAVSVEKALGRAPVAVEQPELVVAQGSVLVGAPAPIDATAWVKGSPAKPVSPAAPAAKPEPVNPADVETLRLSRNDVAPPPTQPPPTQPPAAQPPVAPPKPPAPAKQTPPTKAMPPAKAAPPVKSAPPVKAAPADKVFQKGRASLPSRPTAPAAPPPRPAPTPRPAPAPVAATKAMPRTPSAPQPRPAPAPAPRPAPPRAQPARPPARRRSRMGRFFRALFVTLALIAVPVASAFVAYYLATGGKMPPIGDLFKR